MGSNVSCIRHVCVCVLGWWWQGGPRRERALCLALLGLWHLVHLSCLLKHTQLVLCTQEEVTWLNTVLPPSVNLLQVDIARHMGQSLNVVHLVEAFEDDVSDMWGGPGGVFGGGEGEGILG
jgi:hypothetical protein